MPLGNLEDHLSALQPRDIMETDLPSMRPYINNQSFMEKLDDQWQMGTSIGSLLANGFKDNTKTNFGFNSIEALKGTPYEMYSDQDWAINADSQQELDAGKEQLDREIAASQRIATSGWAGTGAMFVAQIFGAPENLIPILGVANKMKTATQVAKYASTGAALGGGVVAGQEAVLQATQIDRSMEQSAWNIAGGAVLGTILGGGIGLYKLSTNKLADNIVEKLLKGEDIPLIRLDTEAGPRSVGAAETDLNVGDAGLAKMSVNFFGKDYDLSKLLQIPGLRAPVLEGLSADSKTLNSVTSSMFEHSNIEMRNLVDKPDGIILQDAHAELGPYAKVSNSKIVRKDYDTGKAEVSVEYKTPDSAEPITKTVLVDLHKPGTETPVAMETQVKLDRVRVYEYQNQLGSIYREYVDVKPGPFEAARAAIGAKQAGKMTYREMLGEAAGALRRGDKHTHPQVQRMVEVMRKNIDDANVQMKDANVPLPEFALKGRESYFPIVYDKKAIGNDRYGFEKIISDEYIARGMDKAEAEAAAITYADNAIGAGEDAALLTDITRMSLDKGVRFTKERTSDIPDTLMEGYLINDPLHVISQYVTQASQLSRFYKMLATHGVDDLQGLKKKLHSEYEQKETMLNRKDPNYNYKRQKLTNDYQAYQNRLQDFASIMLGQYAARTAADNSLRALRTYNYIRLMGLITVSSITDLAMPIFKHSLGNTLVHGYVQGITNIASKVRHLETDMLKHIGVAIEQELDGTLRTMIDPEFGSNFITRQPKVGVGIGPSTQKLYNDFIYGVNIAGDAASTAFSKATLITYWNKFHKRLAARITISRIIKDLRKYSDLTAHEKEYLNSIGIGEKQVKPILSQFEKYGGADKGGYITDIRSWSDVKAKEIFSGAVLKEVDSTIVTPGRGDIPRFVQHSELARTLFQFKGFFSAMTSKVLVSGLQRHDFAAAQGLIAMLTLGALQYTIRQSIADKPIDTSTNNLLFEGVNRSGMLGLLGDPVFGLLLQHKLGGGSRYYNQNWVEYMGGPSGSLVKKFGDVYQDVRDQKGSDKLQKDVTTLLPFQNLLGIRQLLEKANKN